MNKYFLLFFSFTLAFLYAFPQKSMTSNGFVRIEAVGDLPEPLEEIMGKQTDKGQEKMIISSNEEIRNLIKLGKILYGDSVTQYLEIVLDQVLKNDTQLRKQIHIYSLKSSEVNAFITPNGFLFVNVGLIAQSTSEAEIAFVLSHEIIHYVNKHGLEKSQEVKDIEAYLKYHSRSREKEIEADKLGFEQYYKNAGYSLDAIQCVFDVLQYSNLPFDEHKITRKYFEKDFYKMDDKYFLKSVSPISTRENYIDTFSTHPNIKIRRLEMEKLVQPNPENSSSIYLNGESYYQRIRKIARYETINQQLIDNEFVMAFYNCCVMKNDEKYLNLFLDIAQSSALYGIFKIKMNGNYSDYLPSMENTSGEYQFSANFFEKISKKELALFCLRNIWETKKLVSDDKYMLLMFEDIVSEMVNELSLGTLEKFCDFAIDEKIDSTESIIIDEKKSKYDKIKEKHLVGHQKKFKTENYMLVDLKKDDDFVNAFNIAVSKNESKEANKFINTMNKLDKSKLKDENIFLVFHPSAYVYEDNYKKYILKKKTFGQTKRLEKRIKEMAKMNCIQINLTSNFSDEKIKDYQSNARLNEFFESLNNFSDISYESRDACELIDKIGTPYLNFIRYNQFRLMKRERMGFKLLYAAFSATQLPFLPMGIYQLIHRSYYGNLYFSVYDLKNNAFVYSKKTTFTHEKTSDKFLKTLYEQFYQTKINIVKK